MLFLLFYEDMTLLIGTPYSIFQMVVKHLSVYSVGAAKWKLMAAVDLHPPCFFFKDSWGFLDLSWDHFSVFLAFRSTSSLVHANYHNAAWPSCNWLNAWELRWLLLIFTPMASFPFMGFSRLVLSLFTFWCCLKLNALGWPPWEVRLSCLDFEK